MQLIGPCPVPGGSVTIVLNFCQLPTEVLTSFYISVNSSLIVVYADLDSSNSIVTPRPAQDSHQ
jgi:hypothetical protein